MSHVVADPVHELAAAEVRVPAPVHVDAGLAVGNVGRGADPEIVVELGRRRRDGLLAEGLGEIVVTVRQADLDAPDFSQTAVPDKLGGAVEVLDRALPGAGLPDPAVALDGLAHGAALAELVEEGLLAVDVEPGPGGGDGQDGVPVVGHGDRDGVEVAAEQELAEIVVGGAIRVAVLFIDDALGLLQMVFVEVADGHPLDLVLAQERFHVGKAHHAEPDPGHDDPVRWRDGSVLAQGRSADDRREADRSGDTGGRLGEVLQELPPADVDSFFRHARLLRV